MVPITIYFIYIIIIILIVIFALFASYYQRKFEECANYKSPWCYNDWKCYVPATLDQAKITQMIEAGILPPGTNVGDEYNLKTAIMDKLLTNCKTTTDDSKLTYVNSITGIPCIPSESDPQCKTIPIGCTTTLFGTPLNKDNIWGRSP